MNYTGQTSFADMFEYYCTRNVTNEREYNEREMLRWLKQQLQQAHRQGWEQAKKQAEGIADFYKPEDIGEAIANMEYKEY